MNKRAMRAMGIKAPLALVKKHRGKRHNNNEETGESAPASSLVPTSGDQDIMENQNTAESIETPATVQQPAPKQPTAAKVDLPAMDANDKAMVFMAELGVRQQEAEARKAEAEALKARLAEDARQFDVNHKVVEKKVAWEEEDRKFVNRHVIPSTKFILAVASFFGIAALVGWLTGEDVTETVGELPPA